ncbi:diphosphate--fructose-6-phosphate 1-phosphotransferase [Tuwongella immobilis]|nr:diphosphate--fructose-6-phosphate 1-phosphotransferase [Tuwongella immobilis]
MSELLTIFGDTDMAESAAPGRLGIIVGGGPAPGINGVISAVTIEAINQGFEVYGFRDGFKYLVQGSTEHYRKLSIPDVSINQLRGGSMLGTSRTNPAKNEADMAKVLETLTKLGITDLVTIGGDDTAFSASQVYKRNNRKIRVAHVPKTIDNDLPLPAGTPTFGYETARHYGVGIVRSLHEDAKTTGRWYLIVSMGRAAGHLALGIGKAAAATITVIPEEYRDKEVTLESVADLIIGSMIKRQVQGKGYGVAVLAEGLLESIGEKGLLSALGEEKLSRYGHLERDPHGHLRLGEIEFGRMVKDYLTQRLGQLGIKTTVMDKDLGYELRCADPIPFDNEYTRDLGYGAAKFLRSPQAAEFGAVISMVGGRLVPRPFEEMINPATSRMRTRKVDVDAETYEVARRYMIRLEANDFSDPSKLAQLAAFAKLTPEQFRDRFAYLVS